MNRLQNTARIVAASLKNNPHIQIAEVPDLIRAIHSALPADAIRTIPAAPAPEPVAESAGEQTAEPEVVAEDTDEGDAQPRKSWSEALAASRARFGGGDEGVRDEVDAEAETEAHAS